MAVCRSGDSSTRRDTDEVDFIKTNLKGKNTLVYWRLVDGLINHLPADLTTRSERVEREKADLQKKMVTYKQQYEDLLGIFNSLLLYFSC
jgi:hypothetical protein